MADPGPTNRSPIGTETNIFRLDGGTSALTQARVPGSVGRLASEVWLHLNLRPTGLMIKQTLDRFIADSRHEIFGVNPKELEQYEKAFSGAQGNELKNRVLEAARTVGISPGFLAAVLLFEQGSASFWTRTSGEVSTYEAGADHFYGRRRGINRQIPAAASISIIRTRDEHNEQGNPVTTAYISAKQAVLVVAVTLRDRELVIRRLIQEEGADFESLPQYVRFFLTRLAFNPGRISLRTRVRQALGGTDLLVKSGTRSASRPRRGATVLTALAICLNDRVFRGA